ncbi:MAG: CDP-diacylglycerol--serine O-phosphatidyltransferase [Mongoliibacter sp.]|uniref:CDP-diacylglycerol--serine O-phosphatidyltransferase n=1 Tax=Mongoliibacter sp. TaxID=2022438 RepID=UPI0012F43F0C|nr:CDP-diacylglycerol--serine O-phosphatidyltransferase [Mongoliibacter sp.]TVP53014.1 MAG: CDP-diacylglycerol--serine O-phosphatidyltransferase [Mongoliibacter sp.]
MNIKKHIPNALTSLNLLSGMMGIVFVLNGKIEWGAYLIFIAALFDFLDGFVARILKVHSEIGKQLDSLADLVTFGVLPSFILFQMVAENSSAVFLPYITLVVGVFSALRLAKFNVDTRQTDRFIGVPTPANALLISTLPFFIQKFDSIGAIISRPESLIALSIVMSLLLVAEIPLIALKFKSFAVKENVFRYLTLLIGLICIVTLGLAGIPLVIISYIVLSVLEGLSSKNA